jgi:hypothetical protein
MSHLPVNHHLRPLYRVLAGACGLYILLFGIVGSSRTASYGIFTQDGLPTVLGLRANFAFALLSIVAGAVIVLGAVLGGNLDRWVNLVAGVVFLVAGMAMMTLLRSPLDFLGFTMATCVVSFLIGLLLLTAGLYGRVGPHHVHEREERFRHSGQYA